MKLLHLLFIVSFSLLVFSCEMKQK